MQVGEISKRSSEKWRKLTPDEKRIWEDKAETDKRRYKLEKERYTGPEACKEKSKCPQAADERISILLTGKEIHNQGAKSWVEKYRNITSTWANVEERSARRTVSPH